MKRTFLTVVLVFALVFCLTACGCKHEWNEATCTTPRTCSLCQEIEGEALGHDWKDATCEAPKTCENCGETKGRKLDHSFGEEEIVNPDYVNATATFVKTCEECDEQEEREGTLTQLHDGKVVLMSADDFSARFTEKLMEVQTLLSNDQYLSMITEDDGTLCMYMCRRSNGKITEPGFFVMRDLNDENLAYHQHAEEGAFMGIVGGVKGTEQTAIAFVALIATMNPAMELTEVTQLAVDWLGNPDTPMKVNGLTFTYSYMNSSTNLVGFTVHE